MLNSNRVLGQTADALRSRHHELYRRFRLRGISTFMLLVAQEGNPRSPNVEIPHEAQAFMRLPTLVENRLLEIEEASARANEPWGRALLEILNHQCVELVIMASWKYRGFGIGERAPNLKWVVAEPTLH